MASGEYLPMAPESSPLSAATTARVGEVKHKGGNKFSSVSGKHRSPRSSNAKEWLEGVALLEEGRSKHVGSNVPEWLPDLVICFPQLPCSRGRQAGIWSRVTGSGLYFTDRHLEAMYDRMFAEWQHDRSKYKECAKLLTSETGRPVMIGDLQKALMTDFIKFLDQQHCTIEVFQSCDRDEVFLCISLGDPTKPAQEDPHVLRLAEQKHLRVQTDLTGVDPLSDEARDLRSIRAKESNRGRALLEERALVEERARLEERPLLGVLHKSLNIVQTLSPNEEMFVYFHRQVAEAFTEICGLPSLDSGENKPTFLKRYAAGIAGTEGSVFRSVDRVRLLVSKISEFVDMDDVLSDKLAKTYYAPHNFSKLQEFRNGKPAGTRYYDKKGHVAWANFRFRTIFSSLQWDYECGQPIQDIRNYFGQSVAFHFLWLGYSARCIALSVPVSIALSVVYSLVDQRNPTSYQLRIQMWCHLCATFLFSTGSTMYIKGWRRCQSYYAALWDSHYLELETTCRPDYRGSPAPDPLDEWGKATKEFPAWKSYALYAVAVAVTLFFVILVMISITLIYFLHSIITWRAQAVVSALFSFQILVCQLVWDRVSARLVDLANPRTDRDAKDVAIQFLFPFSFISAYANILFHAFYTAWGHPCRNCLLIMRPSVYQVVIPAMGMQVVKMLLPFLKYRYSLYDEVHQMKQHGTLKEAEEIARCFIEEQSKRPRFTSHELNSEMNIMIVMCGYVVLFGFVAPAISVAVTVAFMLKIRIDAFKLCAVYQRVMPMQATERGLGKWDTVLRQLIVIGRYCACAIPVFNLPYFDQLKGSDALLVRWLNGANLEQKGLTVFQKFAVVFLLEQLLEIIGDAIWHSIPNDSSKTKSMIAKRTKAYAQMTLKMATHERKRASKRSVDEESSAEVQTMIHTIQTERLDSFPLLNREHHLWNRVATEDFSPLLESKTYFGEDPAASPRGRD